METPVDSFTTIELMIGQTFAKVVRARDATTDFLDVLKFTKGDGTGIKFYHDQDSCESVYIEDICGDIEYLENSPILVAEECARKDENANESGTWTFYRFATVRGTVTVRWHGSSNGWYSEGVSICEF